MIDNRQFEGIAGNCFRLRTGAVVALLGVYDRCPIWNALTGMFRRG
jgi:hypothetical protein